MLLIYIVLQFFSVSVTPFIYPKSNCGPQMSYVNFTRRNSETISKSIYLDERKDDATYKSA